jgi:predicted RND superfamily exporter protein
MSEGIISRAVRGLEALIFGGRRSIVALFCLATLAFGWAASHAHLEAGLDKQVPADHPYSRTAREYGAQTGGANVVLLALEAKDGTIFTERFFDELRQVTEDLFYLPGVDRARVKHIYSPNVQVIELADDGFSGAPVIPRGFQPTEAGFASVKANLLKGGLIGSLISDDFKTALVVLPLLRHDPRTRAGLDYLGFARSLETDIKAKYEAKFPEVRIRITGGVRAAGEIADGAKYIALFFLVALVITAFLLYRVSHHWWLTAAPLLCSLAAVIWQIGLVTLLGYGVDVYSVLIPFLILSIGVSHGVQMILSTGQLAASGLDGYEAARRSFRRLFLPGAVALITGVLTFLTITTIEIPVIRELAATATIGIGALAFTNLIWLPLMVSYAKISERTIQKMRAALDRRERFWHLLAILVQPRYAVILSVGAVAIGVGAALEARHLVVGDLDRGAPELRPNSRFNQDTLYILNHFGNGADALIVFATTSLSKPCKPAKHFTAIDDFANEMRFVPGVHGIKSPSAGIKAGSVIANEGDIRWAVISHEPGLMRGFDDDCAPAPISLYLEDHKARTLSGVIASVKDYKTAHPDLPFELDLAAGNGGQAAAINDAVEAAQAPMLALVYLVVIAICAVTFRSLRAVICIIVPLALVSLIANAAMALLGIGLKVSTLPVAALGVGIGVDYGIYKFSRLSHYMGAGMSLQDAYIQTLRETGSAVIFTGLTLSVGVATWVFSPLQFQADMGLLLTLMFFMNMVGAIILLPALIGVMQIVKPQRAAQRVSDPVG